MKWPKQNNEAAGSTRRLLHYWQVSGKKFPPIFGNFRGISRFLSIIPRFLAGPLTAFCENLVGKH